MRYPISKLIWAGLIIALIFLGAMLILPVVGAVLIGVFALSCLIWLSSKIFGFFQGGRTYTEDNPGDYYDASARTSIVPKKWNKTQAVDAEVIEIEEKKKRNNLNVRHTTTDKNSDFRVKDCRILAYCTISFLCRDDGKGSGRLFGRACRRSHRRPRLISCLYRHVL